MSALAYPATELVAPCCFVGVVRAGSVFPLGPGQRGEGEEGGQTLGFGRFHGVFFFGRFRNAAFIG